MTVILACKALLSAMACVIAVTPWLVDYNETHIFNPRWRPHAKYHTAQTLMLASLSGVVALWMLWTGTAGAPDAALRFDMAALFVALYWLTAVPGILLPGTAHEDPEIAGRLPRVGGVVLNQTRVGVVWLLVVATAWWVGRAHLGAA